MSEDSLVQYIVVRRDLLSPPFNWNYGALIAQASHAAVAVVTEHIDDPMVRQYAPFDGDKDKLQMHKVVLQAQSEDQLVEMSRKLGDHDIVHRMWIEHPEKIPTCIAVKPYPKSIIGPLCKAFKLFR